MHGSSNQTQWNTYLEVSHFCFLSGWLMLKFDSNFSYRYSNIQNHPKGTAKFSHFFQLVLVSENVGTLFMSLYYTKAFWDILKAVMWFQCWFLQLAQWSTLKYFIFDKSLINLWICMYVLSFSRWNAVKLVRKVLTHLYSTITHVGQQMQKGLFGKTKTTSNEQ